MKSKSGVSKRFRITSKGYIKHISKGRRHGLSNKSSKRKRQLRQSSYLSKSSSVNILKLILK